MLGGIRFPELLIILVVVLLIFGPKNLPKLGKALGSTVKNVREGLEGGDDAEKTEELSEEDKEVAELEAKLAEAKAKKEAAETDGDSPISKH